MLISKNKKLHGPEQIALRRPGASQGQSHYGSNLAIYLPTVFWFAWPVKWQNDYTYSLLARLLTCVPNGKKIFTEFS